MDRIKSIVVGVDFSPFSRAAIAQAVRLARANQATLRVVHVVESPAAVATAIPSDVGALSFADVLVEDARRHLESAVADAGDVAPVVSVVVGTAYLGLLREARDAGADLLVLGASGLTSDPTRIGAVAIRCVRKCAAKLLLVRGEAVGPFRRVAACIDFSQHTPGVIEQAVRIARADRAELLVLHVHTPPWRYTHYRSPAEGASPQEIAAYRASIEAEMHRAIEPWRAETADLSVRMEAIERVDPHRGVIEALSVMGADLAVIGSRGRTSFRAMLLGSMAEHIFHRAPCSVLTVKPDGFSYSID